MLFEQVIARYNALTSQFQQLTRQELVTRLSARVPVDTRERGGNRTFFKFWLKIFAEFVEKKNSIIFAVVIGVWIDCNLLFSSYKDTKQFALLQFFKHISYTELTLII